MSRHQLAHALNLLLPCNLRKQNKVLKRFGDRNAHAQCCLWILLTNVVRNIREVLRRRVKRASLLKAAEGGLDFGVGCELAAPGLSKTLQHGRKVRGIDFLGVALFTTQAKHGEADLILAVRRQSQHGFKGLFE